MQGEMKKQISPSSYLPLVTCKNMETIAGLHVYQGVFKAKFL